MDHQYSLPVIHPSFELLKKSSRILHFIGASIILVNGIHLLQEHRSASVACYFQFIIAAEIYLVLILQKRFLIVSPGLNLFFRLVESITLAGIGFSLYAFNHQLASLIHFFISAGYFFLFYRECRIIHSEAVDIRQTGITIPNFVRDEEISWPEIKSITPKYHSILIETIQNKRMQFQLSKNLKIDELQQIDEFCRQHIAAL